MENHHLANEGSAEVDFDREQLLAIFQYIINLKQRRTDVQIVNPYISLYQQLLELDANPNGEMIGCSAGRDIFFLGPDETTVRPCYFYADSVVSDLQKSQFYSTDEYETCNACQDQCFRDGSMVY